jgi:PAS domain S-box-containing protein
MAMNFLNEQSLVSQFGHSKQFYFIITDITGRLLHVNSLFSTRTGYSPDQLSSLSITDVIAKDDIHKCFSAIEKCLHQPGHPSATDPLCLQQDGSYSKICWELSIVTNAEEEPVRIHWIGVDEQAKTEEWPQQSELFYRNLIADSLDGILLTNDKGVISFASASVKKILGFEPDELLIKNVFEFLHPDDRDLSMSAFFAEVEQSPGTKFINARIKQKSGQWLWCMVRGHNMLSNPYVGAMLIYFCDDTLRKNAETALIESEQRFRHLIHNLNLGVILVNEKGNIIICNQATANMFEVAEEKLIGRNILQTSRDIIHENGNVFFPDDFPVAVSLQTKKTVRNIVMGIKRLTTDDRMWLLVGADPVLDTKGNILHVISSFTDITEQRRLAQQLAGQEIQKQKQLMQATIDGQEKERREIGRELHDNISQHLTTTRLYLEVAKDKAEGELLRIINQAHKGLMDIVNEIRQLSQSLVPASLSDIGLVESVQDICSPLENTHAFHIDFQYYDFDEALLPENMKLMLFRIIQEQINNIIRHAQASIIQIYLKTGEGEVVLSVADNGKGFDLKSVKKGHGFDNMSNRADLFGGKVSIDAVPGKGCIIQVVIPL